MYIQKKKEERKKERKKERKIYPLPTKQIITEIKWEGNWNSVFDAVQTLFFFLQQQCWKGKIKKQWTKSRQRGRFGSFCIQFFKISAFDFSIFFNGQSKCITSFRFDQSSWIQLLVQLLQDSMNILVCFNKQNWQ